MDALLTTFLAPLLGYLLQKGEAAGEQAVDAFGAAAWDRAKGIWAKLRPKVAGTEAAQEAAQAVADRPDDGPSRGAFQFQLRKILEADSVFAGELREMMREAQQAGVVADNGAVVIAGDVKADRSGVAAGRDVHGGQGGIHTHWHEQ